MSRRQPGKAPFAGGRRPLVRFSAVGEGWDFFKARWATWVVTGLIVVIANGVLYGVVSTVFGIPLPRGGGFRAEVPPASGLLEAVLTAVLNGFFLGGMFRMACRQVRGERFRVSDLFGITDVLTELAIGSAVYGGACCLLAPFGLVPAFLLAGVWMFTIPLIVDARISAFDAIRGSWRALKGEWLAASIFHFVVYAIAGLGGCCLCLGLMFTMPLYCLSIAVLYRDAFPVKPTADFSKPVVHDPDF